MCVLDLAHKDRSKLYVIYNRLENCHVNEINTIFIPEPFFLSCLYSQFWIKLSINCAMRNAIQGAGQPFGQCYIFTGYLQFSVKF